MQHYLSVGAIFKNEGHALREWAEHYFRHGAEHIYLVDDGSTDGGSDTIRDYIERGDVTVFREDHHPYYLGRQQALYNQHILPRIDETHWLLMQDLDEFMWSPRSIDLREVLAQLDHIAQVQIWHTIFGSNGHVVMPKGGLVESYTRRSQHCPTKKPGNHKYFINTARADVTRLFVHSAEFEARDQAPYYFMDESWFVMNHYCCQAQDFWRDVKCTRGDADNWRVRTMDDFALYDLNEVEDTRLLEQNRPIVVPA